MVRPTDGSRSPRPKDAATLILVRHANDGVQILMGQRHSNHVFMPNKFVFPGGSVSASDSRIRPISDLRPEVDEKLRVQARRRNVRALALAAIRETFEETGLLVGRRVTRATRTKSPEWRPYFEQGVAPDLDKLDFIARAITPPMRPRRFDARFFLADASQIQGDMHDSSNASGELLDLRWFSIGEALELDLPHVTRVILGVIEKRLAQPTGTALPVFIRYKNDRLVTETL